MSENETGVVVSLRGAKVPGEPQEELIEILRDLLAQAETGELQFAAFALVDRQEGIGVAWKGDCKAVTSTASVAWLHHRYMTAYNNG